MGIRYFFQKRLKLELYNAGWIVSLQYTKICMLLFITSKGQIQTDKALYTILDPLDTGQKITVGKAKSLFLLPMLSLHRRPVKSQRSVFVLFLAFCLCSLLGCGYLASCWPAAQLTPSCCYLSSDWSPYHSPHFSTRSCAQLLSAALATAGGSWSTPQLQLPNFISGLFRNCNNEW